MSTSVDTYKLLYNQRKSANDLPLDVSSEIQQRKEIVAGQIALWKNKQNHQEVLDKLAALERAHEEYALSVNNLRSNINNVVFARERSILQKDYARFAEDSVRTDDNYTSEVISRQQYISSEFDSQVSGLIQQHVSWEYPSLEVNPADARYSIAMNAADPQYAICINDEISQIVKSKFNEYYATRRLRIYDKVTDIPKNQVGFATCINMFEYMPLDPIKDITKQVFDCLRPGGKFLLSYNNCNNSKSISLLNYDFRSLNTRELMESLLYGQGFDVVSTGDSNDGGWSWLLVAKPGDLTTQKVSAGSVNIIEKTYTWDEFPLDIQQWIMRNKLDDQTAWINALIKNHTDWHLGKANDGRKKWEKYNKSIRIYIASTF
tara:strand:- start:294 stop:1421 length:1128 start_codon:yes stop_codon:yes gene_type:complete